MIGWGIAAAVLLLIAFLPVGAAAKYGADHYIYHGAGKTAKDEPFILLEDKDGNHIGNYRYAIQSDGVILVSKYGGLYEEYRGKQSAAPKE